MTLADTSFYGVRSELHECRYFLLWRMNVDTTDKACCNLLFQCNILRLKVKLVTKEGSICKIASIKGSICQYREIKVEKFVHYTFSRVSIISMPEKNRCIKLLKQLSAIIGKFRSIKVKGLVRKTLNAFLVISQNEVDVTYFLL